MQFKFVSMRMHPSYHYSGFVNGHCDQSAPQLYWYCWAGSTRQVQCDLWSTTSRAHSNLKWPARRCGNDPLHFLQEKELVGWSEVVKCSAKNGTFLQMFQEVPSSIKDMLGVITPEAPKKKVFKLNKDGNSMIITVQAYLNFTSVQEVYHQEPVLLF